MRDDQEIAEAVCLPLGQFVGFDPSAIQNVEKWLLMMIRQLRSQPAGRVLESSPALAAGAAGAVSHIRGLIGCSGQAPVAVLGHDDARGKGFQVEMQRTPSPRANDKAGDCTDNPPARYYPIGLAVIVRTCADPAFWGNLSRRGWDAGAQDQLHRLRLGARSGGSREGRSLGGATGQGGLGGLRGLSGGEAVRRPGRGHRVRCGALAAIAGLALVGCGDATSTTEQAATTTNAATPAVTHQQFVSDLNAICKSGNAAAAKYTKEFEAAQTDTDTAAMADALEHALPLYAKAEQQLGALHPPAPDRAAFARYHRAFTRQSGLATRLAEALRAKDMDTLTELTDALDAIRRDKLNAALDLGANDCGR